MPGGLFIYKHQDNALLYANQAVIEAYHTVWLIKDVETDTFSLYRGDTEGNTAHVPHSQRAGPGEHQLRNSALRPGGTGNGKDAPCPKWTAWRPPA